MASEGQNFAVGDIVYTWRRPYYYGVRQMIIRHIRQQRGRIISIECELLRQTGHMSASKITNFTPSMLHKNFKIAERRAIKIIDNMRNRAMKAMKSNELFIEQCDKAEKTIGEMLV